MYRKGGLNEGIFKQFMRARHTSNCRHLFHEPKRIKIRTHNKTSDHN